MKKTVLILMVVSSLSMAGASMNGFGKDDGSELKIQQKENARLCELFAQKVINYKRQKRDDDLYKRTLISYKERTKKYCENKQ